MFPFVFVVVAVVILFLYWYSVIHQNCHNILLYFLDHVFVWLFKSYLSIFIIDIWKFFTLKYSHTHGQFLFLPYLFF